MYCVASYLVVWLGAVLADPGDRSSRLPLECYMNMEKGVCDWWGWGWGRFQFRGFRNMSDSKLHVHLRFSGFTR